MWASLNSSLTFGTVEVTLFSAILPEYLSPGAVLFTYRIVK